MSFPAVRSDERGFTLIELLVTMTILVVGVFGAIALIDGANARTAVNAQREAATGLAREVLEHARAVPYQRLTPTGIRTELQALPGLGDTDPATAAWTVSRRNNTYALNVQVCSVDDGDDDYGDHAGGSFCPGPTGSRDRSPDDYKRLSLKVNWTRGSITREVAQSTIVANEATSAGPDIQFIDQDPPGGLPVDNTVTNSSWARIRFTVQTSEQAAAIKYLVDGVVKSTVNPSGTTSTFDWRLDGGSEGHLPDGTYVISATAYDDRGRPGPTRSRTIRLNRDLPQPPANLDGGWNALRGVAEMDWSRNPEPDVIGYRVYRDTSSGRQLVCEFVNKPSQTSCVDGNPPSDPSFTYVVVGLDDDPDTGSPREGASSSLSVTRSSTQPNAPALLTANASGDDLVLNWILPLPALPPYSGDAISFYRIYRDGTSIADRLGIRSPGSSTSYTDGGAGAGGHKYWITAVDQNYSESPLVGPVSAP
jgi:prepilin-type N-terminal cleavage/methylation domain-containing protein